MTETTKTLIATEEELKWINSSPTFQHKITICVESGEIDYHFALVPTIDNNITNWRVFMLSDIDGWIVVSSGFGFIQAQQFIVHYKNQLNEIYDLKIVEEDPTIEEPIRPFIEISDKMGDQIMSTIGWLGTAYIFYLILVVFLNFLY